MPRLQMEISRIKGQGVYVQHVLDNLKVMQCELEALGCKVHIEVEGTELAGNETRTRDILLGKNSVTLMGENASTKDPAEWEQCGECGGFRIKTIHKDLVIELFSPLMPGANWFECKDCGHVWCEVAE